MQKLIVKVVLACVAGGVAVTAQAAEMAMGAQVSSLGLGVQLATPIKENLNARFGLNGFTYSDDGTEDGIDYDIDMSLRSGSALLDWHPQGGGFRVSGGLLINGNELNMEASGVQDYEIGNDTYRGNLDVDGDVTFRQVAPYLGIGWGNPFSKDKGWSFSADLGVVLQGTPEADLDATGTATRLSDGTVINVTNDPQFQADLAAEEENLQDALDDFEFYPVISLGAMYRF